MPAPSITEPAGRPWAPCAAGLTVTLRVTSRASRDDIDGIVVQADGRAVLQVRVRAVPEDGRANQAVQRLLAERLDVPRSAVSLVEGAASRIKRFVIAGDGSALAARLEAPGR